MWFKNSEENKYYKFKSLNTYSWDRAFSHLRKFRRVFDKNEISYLSASLEFYNKLFDEKDWEAKIILVAHSLNGEEKVKEYCTKTREIKVLKNQNTVTTEFGWGADKYGKIWGKGDYIWEAFINDELVGSTKFRIEDVGKVSPSNNPYLEVYSLKTYESSNENTPEENRLYLKHFSKKDVRYVMAELKYKSKLDYDWKCELFFNFYDDTGLLVGVADKFKWVNPDSSPDELNIVTAGWGNDNGNIWIDDFYRIEVVFMDTVIAMIPFIVSDTNKERLNENEAIINEGVASFYEPSSFNNIIKNAAKSVLEDDDPSILENSKEEKTKEIKKEAQSKPTTNPEVDDRSVEEILAEFDRLVGLKKIKSKIKEYVDYVTYLQYRKEKGIKEKESINLHSVFTGNPGTGKTTVVKLLGKIYYSMGLLSKGHVLTVSSNDLIAGFVRQTGKNTKEYIKKARGGILFIDEAYMLYKKDASNDFGPEAIDAILTEMSDGPGDIAIMMAGYPKEMESFIQSNPGLKSRFRNYYHFDDYTPTELVEIAKYACKNKDVILNKKALIKLKKIVTEAFRKRDFTFGNARLVHSMIDEAKMNLGIRLVRNYKPEKITKKLLTLIEEEDIEDLSKNNKAANLQLDIDTILLEESLAELNTLTGLTTIKQEVQELIRLTKYYKEIDRDILKAFSMHSIFLGNPGTGKTTVARIIGKIYKALGLLERGHLVEADGGDLIAGYVGQTSIKTKNLIKKAMGGVLFIDEAYAITESSSGQGGNDFGKKAIAALIKEMEDHRGEFALIVAGYTDNMRRFLETNPGMKSRFDRTFHFLDFTEEELWEITVNMFAQKGLKTDAKAKKHIKTYISHLYQNRNKFFGNARSIRKLVEKSYRNQELRMANLEKAKRTKKIMATLVLEDVLEFDSSKVEILKRARVGFK